MRYADHLITDLGDSALLVPASAMLLGYLLYIRSARTAGIGAATAVICALLTILAKLTLYACGTALSVPDLRSPSGHTSTSVTFYGSCGLTVRADKERLASVVLVFGSAALAVAIALSRVLLQAHTIGDVAAGVAIGALCVAWFTSCYFSQPPLPWGPAVVVLGFVALARSALAHRGAARASRPIFTCAGAVLWLSSASRNG